MEDEDILELSREHWGEAARGWAKEAEERERGPAGAAAARMLELAALEPGENVLELACGAGDVGLRAAGQVGPHGRVVCSDFAEPMLEIVRERAQARGLTNVEARLLDAEQAGPLDGERFHAVLCRFGYMLLADPAKALRGSREALRPGGRLVFAVWGHAEANPWLSLVFAAVMHTLGAPPPEPGTPGPFALADHDRLRTLFDGAGFATVALEDLRDERRFESPDDWWAGVEEGGGPVSAIIGGLQPDQVSAIRKHALAAAREHVASDGSVRLPASVVVGHARRDPQP